MTDGIDAIGDIHGHDAALEALLASLGYAERGGAWRHPTRTAAFVGDVVDRGPGQLRALDIVRRMVDAGSAVAAMGNHELNALSWFRGARARTRRNRDQHAAFLDAVGDGSRLHAEWVAWMERMPVRLRLPGLRVVHACWHPASLDVLEPHLRPDGALTEGGLSRALAAGDPLFEAVGILLKGVESELPPGLAYLDAQGHARTVARTAWWDPGRATLRQAALLVDGVRDALPDEPLPASSLVDPGPGAPVVFGHYWMTGEPAVFGGRLACLDYSVARGGPLVAYRHDGGPTLDPSRFVAAAPGAPAPVPR